MSDLAADVHELTGFENFGVPFCTTIEAEALGSEVDCGTREHEPKIEREAFPSVEAVVFLPPGSLEKNARVAAVARSVSILSQKYSDVPVIGSLTGPLSTSASIVDPMTFLKQLRKNGEAAHRVVDYVCGHLIEYARLMVENGATAISIADPTATGEILGPKLFQEYAVPYLNKVTDAIHQMGVPVIIHICGDIRAVKVHLDELHGDALSTDAMVNLRGLKEDTGLTTMGNVSTYLLEFGEAEAVHDATRNLLKGGVDIVAPACGLSTSTPLRNIRALTEASTSGN
jgi:[methyl-Co(III) methanol-specific corrinoid protein]:coenzyme M methyltransferase